jgi:hypothetical protein
MIRRAAWAVLSKALQAAFVVGAITSGKVDIAEAQSVSRGAGFIIERVARHGDSPSKSRDVLLCIGKNVVITSPSPQIQKLSAELHVLQVLRSQGCGWMQWSEPSVATLLGAEQSASDLTIVYKLIVTRQFGVTQFARGMEREPNGWSFSRVFDGSAEAPIILACLRVPFPITKYVFENDKSPLIGNQRFQLGGW